ncbi:MAG TPA: tricarballylate utilization 4Fe-4S protein TcuB [Candidatus Elarobacter sp.]|nr:tricarballylate utilization 4Fe-4S protein TcuB [Candidatus Elarobacter sp.]
MLELDLIAETERQFGICNACRYCEGFCAVFPAAEGRTAFGGGDVAYLANLCHDCRMCFDACPFTPPHEYAVNIPALLAAARAQTYERYAWPRALARLLRVPGASSATIAAVAFAVLLVLAIASSGAAAFLAPHTGPGAFYRIFSFGALLSGALLFSAFGIVAIVAGAMSFARDTGVPVRSAGALARAAHEALALVYLRGGGAGCYDAHRGSSSRRVLHGFVFWGFLAAFASTTAAAVEQDLLGIIPPFPLLSVPVVLGVLGGVAILAGAVGLIALKRRSDSEPVSHRMIVLDYAFLAVLALVALSGLLLLALRTTAAMPALLVAHLALLVALYATAPYGKFVHFVYRYLSLVKHAAESAPARAASTGGSHL